MFAALFSSRVNCLGQAAEGGVSTCSGSKVAGTSMKPGSNLKGQGWPHRGRKEYPYWDTADRSNRVSNSGIGICHMYHMDIRNLPKLQ